MHYPESRFIIRRVRVPADSELLEPLRQAGYYIEPDVGVSISGIIPRMFLMQFSSSQLQVASGFVSD